MACRFQPTDSPPFEKDVSAPVLVGEVTILSPKSSFAQTIKNQTFGAIEKAKVATSLLPSVIESKLSLHSKGLLQLKPLSSYLGKPSVIFKKSDKNQLIEQLNHVLIAKFSHGLPSSEIMHNFLLHIKFEGDYVVSLYDSKHVFIEFQLFDDFTKLWLKRNWVIKGFHVRFFKWTSSFQSNKESSIVPIWVHLPGLPLYLFEEEALLSVANAIGKPLNIDRKNLNRSKIGYATVCVEIDISKPLFDEIWIEFEEDGTKNSIDGFWQRVVYSDIPVYCSVCHHLGHKVELCKRGIVGKERKVVLERVNSAEILGGFEYVNPSIAQTVAVLDSEMVSSHSKEAMSMDVVGEECVEKKATDEMEVNGISFQKTVLKNGSHIAKKIDNGLQVTALELEPREIETVNEVHDDVQTSFLNNIAIGKDNSLQEEEQYKWTITPPAEMPKSTAGDTGGLFSAGMETSEDYTPVISKSTKKNLKKAEKNKYNTATRHSTRMRRPKLFFDK